MAGASPSSSGRKVGAPHPHPHRCPSILRPPMRTKIGTLYMYIGHSPHVTSLGFGRSPESLEETHMDMGAHSTQTVVPPGMDFFPHRCCKEMTLNRMTLFENLLCVFGPPKRNNQKYFMEGRFFLHREIWASSLSVIMGCCVWGAVSWFSSRDWEHGGQIQAGLESWLCHFWVMCSVADFCFY